MVAKTPIYVFFFYFRYVGLCAFIKIVALAIFGIDWWLVKRRKHIDDDSPMSTHDVVGSIISLDKCKILYYIVFYFIIFSDLFEYTGSWAYIWSWPLPCKKLFGIGSKTSPFPHSLGTNSVYAPEPDPSILKKNVWFMFALNRIKINKKTEKRFSWAACPIIA